MSLLEIEPAAGPPPGDWDSATTFAADLAILMPFLRSLSQSLSGKRELAEDLAQEAVASAWQFRRSFTPGTNLKAWLCTILRNEYSSYQRRAWRQLPWVAELEDAVAVPPGQQQWSAELSDVACALNALHEQQREALVLVGVCGFTYGETALLLRKALGTVKSRVGRGRQHLTKILESPKTRRVKMRPSTSNALHDWFEQIEQLRACANQALNSGDFERFRVCRATPKMSVLPLVTVRQYGASAHRRTDRRAPV
jgi:RNA polymerase sigma-70 factor, ECF subfamily